MYPIKELQIGNNKIEQFYYGGEFVVYINNKLTNETFEEAVERLKKLENKEE
ncbi:hypothetical protein [Caminicella sporogenes]|uniref:hypothetical protein n=1 Tax=Caminicella sporogenes TaxID=166485 RepID=UPI002540C707|nr:hypothetical protein [Caminicella sporogenes]WIF95141.1 hypothetical protein QNI18_00435 [Caminicella sporogenes]